MNETSARREALANLATVPDGEARLLLATGRYIGEGFDDAQLDTLFLAMPVSWKGTLIQYSGRLQRLYAGKTEVQIYDYVDREVPMLLRMFERRLRGYRAIGYAPVKKENHKTRKGTKRKHQRASSRRSSVSPSLLERMISEAIVDGHDNSEQATGLFNMIEEKLRLPFSTIVLGIQVTVERIDLNEAEEIVAVCAKGPERQRIPIVDLPLPSVQPEGAEWIEAYRRWARGR